MPTRAWRSIWKSDFNGHLFSARREAAHYQSLASDQRLRDLQQQIEHDVRTAWIAASNALQRIPVTEEFVKQANLAFATGAGEIQSGPGHDRGDFASSIERDSGAD